MTRRDDLWNITLTWTKIIPLLREYDNYKRWLTIVTTPRARPVYSMNLTITRPNWTKHRAGNDNAMSTFYYEMSKWFSDHLSYTMSKSQLLVYRVGSPLVTVHGFCQNRLFNLFIASEETGANLTWERGHHLHVTWLPRGMMMTFINKGFLSNFCC